MHIHDMNFSQFIEIIMPFRKGRLMKLNLVLRVEIPMV